MKRLICLILVIVMLLTVTACGDNAAKWQEQYDLGMRYLSDGNYEEAIIAFEAAIEIDPKQADAYISLADTYIAMGDYVSAEKVLKNGFEQTGNNLLQEKLNEIKSPDSFIELANTYIEAEEYEKAQQILRQAIERCTVTDELREMYEKWERWDKNATYNLRYAPNVSPEQADYSLGKVSEYLPYCVCYEVYREDSNTVVSTVSVAVDEYFWPKSNNGGYNSPEEVFTVYQSSRYNVLGTWTGAGMGYTFTYDPIENTITELFFGTEDDYTVIEGKYLLLQEFPYGVPANISIRLYDMFGNLIDTLADNEYGAIGCYDEGKLLLAYAESYSTDNYGMEPVEFKVWEYDIENQSKTLVYSTQAIWIDSLNAHSIQIVDETWSGSYTESF